MRLRPLLPLTLTLALGAACGGVGSPFGDVRGATHNCADQFANAMASKQAVKGTWGCLGEGVQDQFRAVGIEGDDGVARLAAKEPVYTGSKFMGRLSDGGYIYSMSGAPSGAALIVWLDRSGRIIDLRTAGRSQGGGG